MDSVSVGVSADFAPTKPVPAFVKRATNYKLNSARRSNNSNCSAIRSNTCS